MTSSLQTPARTGRPAWAATPRLSASLSLRLSLRLSASLLAALLSACATAPVPTQPRPLSLDEGKCTQPPYPAAARDSGAEGTTTLSFDVNAEGRVTRVAIVEPSGTTVGHRALDALALETLRKCVFPAAPGFLPASSRMAYAWRLKD